MDKARIINELKAERGRIDLTLKALGMLTPRAPKKVVWGPTTAYSIDDRVAIRGIDHRVSQVDRPVSSPVRKTLSAEHRARISRAMTKRNAERRAKKGAKH